MVNAGKKKTGLIIILLVFIINTSFSQIVLNTPNTESILYLSKGKKQPLVVGLGGSEGGNEWIGDYWKSTRDRFKKEGYAFLAIGYFGAKGTPQQLEKIALEDVHNAILEAAKNSAIDKEKIAIVGGSRGADLALLIASYYTDIKCVVALVASHVTFPGNTDHFTTSSWTYNNEQLPYVPVNDEAIPFIISRDLRTTFETMLKDTISEKKALIKVENINGPILFISATKDEICPSTPMSEKMVLRLKEHNFKYHYEHIAIEGGHAEPLNHFDTVFNFLEKNFKGEAEIK